MTTAHYEILRKVFGVLDLIGVGWTAGALVDGRPGAGIRTLIGVVWVIVTTCVVRECSHVIEERSTS